MKIADIKKALPVLIQNKITPLIVGHRGVGKTESVRQFAEENGYELVEIRLGQMGDAGDLLGMPEFKRNNIGNIEATQFFPPNILPKGDKKFILFLDEINRCHKDLLQAVFELVYDRKMTINGFNVPEGSGVVAAMNPPGQGYDVLDFNDEAFNDRFCHIKFEPTLQEWVSHAKKSGVKSAITSFIETQPTFLDGKLEEFVLDYVKPSRRSWFVANKIMESMNDESIKRELVMGVVGTTAAVTYFEHEANYQEEIRGKDILANFKKYEAKIKEYSNVDTSRNDILNNCLTEITETLESMGEYSPEVVNNLKQFLFTIPKDLAYSFMTANTFLIKLSPILSKDTEVLDFLRGLVKVVKPSTSETANV